MLREVEGGRDERNSVDGMIEAFSREKCFSVCYKLYKRIPALSGCNPIVGCHPVHALT